MLACWDNSLLYSAEHIASVVPLSLPEGDVPLWDFKHTVEELRVIEEGDDPYVYNAQYLQRPMVSGGNMFKDKYWRYYEELPKDLDTIRIYCDTAQKTKERNDYSVFQAWGRNRVGIYLIDQVRGKWEAPELEGTLVEFYEKHKPTIYKPVGASVIKIEDKSSGSSLIQSLQRDYLFPVEGIPRHTDKVLRAHGCIKHFASGHVYLPKLTPWLHDYKQEFREFSAAMNHAHDDQIDPTMDAVEDLLVRDTLLYTQENLK